MDVLGIVLAILIAVAAYQYYVAKKPAEKKLDLTVENKQVEKQAKEVEKRKEAYEKLKQDFTRSYGYPPNKDSK